MSEQIDHAAKAGRLVLKTDGYIERNALQAQVHATLALVEQQRIANLIALATGVDVIGGAGIARMASDEAHLHLTSDPNGELLPEIRHALGIS